MEKENLNNMPWSPMLDEVHADADKAFEDEREELNRSAGEVETTRQEQADIRHLASVVIDSVEGEFAEIKAQRDELLAACKAAIKHFFVPGRIDYGGQNNTVMSKMAMADYEQVSAAIARAEGD